MNVKLCKYNRKCLKLYHKWLDDRTNTNLETKYRNYRKTLVRLKKYERTDFYNKLFKKIGNNSKTMWSIINSISKKVVNKIDITELLIDGKKVSEPNQISNVMNKHFACAGMNVQKCIKTCNDSPSKYMSNCKTLLKEVRTNESEVTLLINNLKSKTRYGCDNISNVMLKKIVYAIRVPLCHIYNRSLCENIFPDSMKIAKIKPMLKSGSTELCDNY